MDDLTRRQEDTLNFIKKYIVSHGYPPTVREIGSALGVSSPATIQAHINNLEEKGFIRKQESKNRAIELLVDNEFESKDDMVIEVP
ncbi:MAG: MarR family transcriptional regulator, partial [Bacilli bacterium]|nr:MarR family transcriptional regulator [Bacilli bacterium]